MNVTKYLIGFYTHLKILLSDIKEDSFPIKA